MKVVKFIVSFAAVLTVMGSPLNVWAMEESEQLAVLPEDAAVENASVSINTDREAPFTEWFEDELFAKAVAKELNRQPSDPVSLHQLSRIEGVACPSQEIKSLNGIENLSNLEVLNCSDNQLTELDLSQNLALKILFCSSNQLKQVDLHQNKELKWLSLNYNSIQDFSLIPDNEMIYFSARCQSIVLDQQEGKDNKITVQLSEDSVGKTGQIALFIPHNRGIYDPRAKTITWENLPDSGKVSYSFEWKGQPCAGKVIVPYQMEKRQAAMDIETSTGSTQESAGCTEQRMKIQELEDFFKAQRKPLKY